MATYSKFQSFVEYLAEAEMDLGVDTLKVMLTSIAPVATNTVKANLTEIAAGDGYTAGGEVTAQTVSAQTTGTYKLTLTDIVWTAVAGTFAAFRYVALYDDTPAVAPIDPLIGFWDYGSALSLGAGETFTWDQDGAGNGVLTLA